MVSQIAQSPIHLDGSPVLDDWEMQELQTLTPPDVPRFTPDLSQMYEDILLGFEPMRPITSKAMEYLNRWVMGKMSTEDTISNLDAIGYLDWYIPAEHLELVMNLEN